MNVHSRLRGDELKGLYHLRCVVLSVDDKGELKTKEGGKRWVCILNWCSSALLGKIGGKCWCSFLLVTKMVWNSIFDA